MSSAYDTVGSGRMGFSAILGIAYGILLNWTEAIVLHEPHDAITTTFCSEMKESINER